MLCACNPRITWSGTGSTRAVTMNAKRMMVDDEDVECAGMKAHVCLLVSRRGC